MLADLSLLVTSLVDNLRWWHGACGVSIDRLWNIHHHAVGVHPLKLVLGQVAQVPIIRRQDNGRAPQEDFVREHLRRGLAQKRTINVRL